MSSHTNLPSPKPIPKPDHRITTQSHPKKPPSSSSSATSLVPSQDPQQQQQTLKCPRCNSPNTKFCYYNNYSLTQPRHFCKSCRRYWTRGGALRNVPIGGGCRKTKKSIKPNSSSSTINTTLPPSSQRFFSSVMDHHHQDSSRFFPPPLPPPPPPTTMDFQLAGLSLNKLNNDLHTSSSSYQTTTSAVPLDVGSGLSLMGFGDYNNNNQSSTYTTTGENNLASSIETLSCLNQDLHWRLQQQRMAMFFGSKDHDTSFVVERPQPILYQNLEIVNSSPTKRGEEENNNQTEWYFGNNGENEGVISNNNNGGSNEWNNGIQQAWTDLNHYHHHALP